jgi:hypothetical protein
LTLDIKREAFMACVRIEMFSVREKWHLHLSSTASFTKILACIYVSSPQCSCGVKVTHVIQNVILRPWEVDVQEDNLWRFYQNRCSESGLEILMKLTLGGGCCQLCKRWPCDSNVGSRLRTSGLQDLTSWYSWKVVWLEGAQTRLFLVTLTSWTSSSMTPQL